MAAHEEDGGGLKSGSSFKRRSVLQGAPRADLELKEVWGGVETVEAATG